MPVSPIPRGVYPSVTALDPKALRARGITLVLADLDNTLVPYGVTEPPEEIVAWKQELEAEGADFIAETPDQLERLILQGR